MPNKIIIVDENDHQIDLKERGNLVQSDIYRVSALWLTNSKGEILLAQRSFNKNHDPGKWGPAVAGTVDEGEDYYINIIKKIEEEIGLKNIPLTEGPKKRITGIHNYFGQWYLSTIDKPIEEFKIQEEEVEQIKWWSKEAPELFLRTMPSVFRTFFGQDNKLTI